MNLRSKNIGDPASSLAASARAAGLRLSEVGEGAVLLEATGDLTVAVQSRFWALTQPIEAWPSVKEVVLGMTNLLVIYDPFQDEPECLGKRLIELWTQSSGAAPSDRVVHVPVVYGGEYGPDLKDVAAHAGLSVAEVVRLHTQARYVVYAIGSSPGFGYLGGLPEVLFTPRRAVPILRAEARSVMIGGNQTGVTTSAGPTGWHVIGRSDASLFDMNAQPPALLAPGDVVKFDAVKVIE